MVLSDFKSGYASIEIISLPICAPSAAESSKCLATCFGSKVCGYYGEKNKDTNIDFISSPYEKKFATNVKTTRACEDHVRKNFNTISHGTPGVEQNNYSQCNSNDINSIKYHKF